MKKEKEKIKVNKKEWDNIDKSLKSFSSDMARRIQDLEGTTPQLCVLHNASAGLYVELHSNRLNVKELSKIAKENFNFLKNQKLKHNLSYIN